MKKRCLKKILRSLRCIHRQRCLCFLRYASTAFTAFVSFTTLPLPSQPTLPSLPLLRFRCHHSLRCGLHSLCCLCSSLTQTEEGIKGCKGRESSRGCGSEDFIFGTEMPRAMNLLGGHRKIVLFASSPARIIFSADFAKKRKKIREKQIVLLMYSLFI